MFYRPLIFALRDHVTSFLWKWKLHDFAFEKRLVGHILNKIVAIWSFQTRTIFLKMSKFVPGHVTKMCSVNFWHPQDSNSLFNGGISYVTRWPPIGICSGFTLKSFSLLRFAHCPFPLLRFSRGLCSFSSLFFYLFPTKPAAKNRSYSLTCIFSGCASSPNRILQLFTRSTRKINSHLYVEEFSECDRTYPTGMNHSSV